MQTAGKSEIWIIDDHSLFSEGLKQMLSMRTKSYEIHCFRHPAEATLAPQQSLALITLDFYIPGADTLDSIRQFSTLFPQTPLVVISSSTSMADKKQCLNLGATAYYPKHAPPDVTLKSLVRFLESAEGNASRALERSPTLELPQNRNDLTAKQVEILIQLARGYSNKKIAALLSVSPETVKSHLSAIYRETGCASRDEAVQWARDKGFV